jgi:hypothetical protein
MRCDTSRGPRALGSWQDAVLMRNEEARAGFASLRARTGGGELTVEEVGSEFERLTWSLAGVSREDDELLRSLVNEVELIRFTQLPETQKASLAEVFERAQPVFDRANS